MRVTVILILITISNLAFASGPGSASPLNTAANASYLSPLEKEIVYEINLFRSNPARYAEKYIAPLAKNYQKNLLQYPGDLPIKTVEGVKALHECVRELKRATPKPILYPNKALTNAAGDHCRDQSKTGRTGHTGSDNSNLKTRIERYGKWKVRIAENIAYGNTSARQMVVFLLIDDNVKDRGHRANMLNPDFKLIGVSTATHPEYLTMCVMNFAGGMENNNEK
ncbi:MAG: SCP-like extracellular [Prolixibacteraceae bacterium]|nr:MAG: SCP-like extracellular [Prolixibacteraceae bacterium]